MANSKRSTRKSCRKVSNRRVAAFLADFQKVLSRPEIVAVPVHIPLTRSQRLSLGDLSSTTGISVNVWVRRAIDNFLHDEAPVFADSKIKDRRSQLRIV